MICATTYRHICTFLGVHICLYLPISVSLMRRQRARDSIVILSRSRSRRGIHTLRPCAGPARPADGAGAATSRATTLIATRLAGETHCSNKESEPRSGRQRRPERGVGVLRTFGILLVLELAFDDLGLGATALGCDYILTSSNQHRFVRSYSAHYNTNENSECS